MENEELQNKIEELEKRLLKTESLLVKHKHLGGETVSIENILKDKFGILLRQNVSTDKIQVYQGAGATADWKDITTA